MATVLVRHRVNDFAQWKTVYDESKAMAKSKGCKRQVLLKSETDPNELVVMSEFDSMDAAKQFAQSEELKQAMQRAGVAGEPSVSFLEGIEDVTL